MAKVSDNVATASILAALLGGFVDKNIGLTIVVVLVLLGFVFLCISYILRIGEGNGN